MSTITRILLICLTIGLGVVQTGLGSSEVKTLVHGGRTRSYRVHLPPSYQEGSPTALVFALHGYGDTAAGFEKTIGFNHIADREGFIVVYPNAVAFGAKQKQLWNGGGIYETWWEGRVDDVSFFAKLIDTVSSHYTIDPNRIFVFGTSSGGFMAHHLGARLPDRFAAIAPWAGLLAYNDFVAGPPVSVIHFHGGQDQKVLYKGLPNWRFFGVEHGIRLWAKRNKCKFTPIVVSNDPNTLVRRWAAPTGTGDVVLYKLKNQGHEMPAPSTCNIPEIAWTFFKNHPRSNAKAQRPESQSPAEPFAKGPYLGQTPPGPVAQVFAPGLICDTRPHRHEIHGHFSADGNTFCYRKLGYVYITENTDQGWTKPKRIRNIPYKAWSCCLSPDGNTIYFLDQFSIRSNRSANEPAKHVYRRCVRSSQGWSMPQQLGPPFTSAFGGFSVTADHSICFKSGKGYFEIAPFVGNTWAQPIEIPVEKGNLNPCHPGIAPDGSFLIFYSIAPGAQGGTPTDLYLMLRGADGTWTKPHRMGPGINTEYYEMGARISPDKKYMFFTRSNGWSVNRATDTADIYWVELKDYLPESHR